MQQSDSVPENNRFLTADKATLLESKARKSPPPPIIIIIAYRFV